MSKEIERKFLVECLPNEAIDSSTDIIQGYLAYTDKYEIRVRSSISEDGTNNCTLTVKSSSEDPKVRDEIEMPISYVLYNDLITSCGSRTIHKTRHKISIGEYTAELDVYHGRHKGLRIVEVEFNSVEKAIDFILPKWFGKDVTGDQAYKNSTLATSVCNFQRNPFDFMI